MLFLLVFKTYADPYTGKRDSEISSILVNGAKNLISLSCITEAKELLKEALDYYSVDADANYLYALLSLNDGGTKKDAIEMLDTSLSQDAFNVYSRKDALFLRASLLTDTCKYNEAISDLNKLETNADVLYLLMKNYLLAENYEKASNLLLESIQRFPNDSRAAHFWLYLHNSKTDLMPNLIVLDKIFSSISVLKENEPDILYLLSPYASSIDETRKLIKEYRALGKSNADEIVKALYFGVILDSKAIEQIFSLESLDIYSLEKLYTYLSSDESRIQFINTFNNYSGLITEDKNHDMISDSFVWYAKGQIERFVLDNNQDNIADIEASFSSGEVKKVLVNNSNGIINVYEYESWPFVHTLSIIEKDKEQVFLFNVDAFKEKCVDIVTVCADRRGNPYFVRVGNYPTLSSTFIANNAYKVNIKTPEMSMIADLYNGYATKSYWKDQYGSTGISYYTLGTIKEEEIDFDNDGIKETRKIWQIDNDGKSSPICVMMDCDSDGLYEYRESFVKPYTKSWDFDGDGFIDAAYEEYSKTSYSYRFFFSPGRGGTLVKFDYGIISSVISGSTILPISYDKNVVWIGPKLFDFGDEKPMPGYGYKDGYRYRIIEVNSLYYAEILE